MTLDNFNHVKKKKERKEEKRKKRCGLYFPGKSLALIPSPQLDRHRGRLPRRSRPPAKPPIRKAQLALLSVVSGQRKDFILGNVIELRS